MKERKIVKKVFLLTILLLLALIVSSNKALAVNDINIGDGKDTKEVQKNVDDEKIMQDYTYCINPLDEKFYTARQKKALEEKAKKDFAAMNKVGVESQFGSSVTYKGWADTRKAFQKALVNRTGTIKLYCKIKSYKALKDAMYSLWNEAVSNKYAYSSDLGDYMALTFSNWNCNVTCKYQSGYYKYYFVYKMSYKTNLTQEKKLKSKISSFKKSYNPGKKTGFEKIYDIHDYICDNVTYDYYHYQNYPDSYLLQYTAYAALINKTAVCQGYATLYYKMLRDCGVNNRVMTSRELNHAWNYVKLNGKWYFVDSTWDDENAEKNGGSNLVYFMKGIYDFTGHNASDYNLNIASYDYADYGLDVEANRIDISKATAETKYYQYKAQSIQYNGTLSYHGSNLRLNKDYRIDSCYNNYNVGTASVQITGLGKFKGTRVINYYIILPAPGTFYTTDVTDKTISLYWSGDSRAAKYLIKNVKTKKVIKEVTGTNTCTMNVTPATKYELSVQNVTYVAEKDIYKNSSPTSLTVCTKPSRVSGIKASEIKDKQMKLSWKKQTGVTGYTIYIHDDDNDLSWSKNSTKNTYTLKDLTPYTRYTISILAYKDTSLGRTVGDEEFLHEIRTTISGSYIKKVTPGKKKATVTWNLSNPSEGYQIYMRTGKKGKFVKIKEITNKNTVSLVKKSLKKGKMYYFKVRTFKTIDGKRVYSFYSAAKGAKVK